MAQSVRCTSIISAFDNYSVNFFEDKISVTVTDQPFAIRRWINTILFRNRRRRFSHRLVVGVGVQWTVYSNGSGPADTLQLCVGRKCLIIQLRNCARIPRILRRFLTDSNRTFVGINNHQDMRKLGECMHRLKICDVLDLTNHVTNSNGESLRGCSFGTVVEECLGYEGAGKDTEVAMSDWGVSGFLSLPQIFYATVDAFVCWKLGVRFSLWEV